MIELGCAQGVKIDNCGASHNVTLWAELFNQTGKAIRIESCHTFHPNHVRRPVPCIKFDDTFKARYQSALALTLTALAVGDPELVAELSGLGSCHKGSRRSLSDESVSHGW